MDKKTLSHEVVKKLHLCGHFLHFRMGCMSGKNRIMAQLHCHGQMRQKELQERLHLQSGSMSEIIIKMEAEGLIEKVRCEHDGRNLVLRLTEQGLQEAERKRNELNKTAEQLMEGTSEEDLLLLHEKLDTLLHNWHDAEERRTDDQNTCKIHP